MPLFGMYAVMATRSAFSRHQCVIARLPRGRIHHKTVYAPPAPAPLPASGERGSTKWWARLSGGFTPRPRDYSLGSPSGSTSAASYFFGAGWTLVHLVSNQGVQVLPSAEISPLSVRLIKSAATINVSLN